MLRFLNRLYRACMSLVLSRFVRTSLKPKCSQYCNNIASHLNEVNIARYCP